jgi:hypothetical protein
MDDKVYVRLIPRLENPKKGGGGGVGGGEEMKKRNKDKYKSSRIA